MPKVVSGMSSLVAPRPAMAGKMPPPPCARKAFSCWGRLDVRVHSSHSRAFLWEEASFPQIGVSWEDWESLDCVWAERHQPPPPCGLATW